MSNDVFRYIIDADEEQLQQMKLTIEKIVQEYWREKITSQSSIKTDDVGDALLHALDKLLYGSTNFKQLVPAVSAREQNSCGCSVSKKYLLDRIKLPLEHIPVRKCRLLQHGFEQLLL